jgi:methylated-DNA-[protein]-cysteine S-methyltransferase
LHGIEFLVGTATGDGTPKDPLAREILGQLGSYFQDGKIRFHLPVNLCGTEFQNRVWRFLSLIEPGQVLSCGEIARRLGSSPRAVGNACRRNPVPIVIPCHRVVSARGIGGYGGETGGDKLGVKRWLLSHEGVML